MGDTDLSERQFLSSRSPGSRGISGKSMRGSGGAGQTSSAVRTERALCVHSGGVGVAPREGMLSRVL